MIQQVPRLNNLPALRNIGLDCNELNSDGIDALCTALNPTGTSLHVLSLYNNMLDDHSISMLSRNLHFFPNLRILGLGRNHISFEGICTLSQALPCLTQLQEIYLYESRFQEAGLLVVLDALRENSMMRIVCLTNNHCRPHLKQEVVAKVCETLPRFQHLREFYMHGCGFESSDDYAILRVLGMLPFVHECILDTPLNTLMGLPEFPFQLNPSKMWMQLLRDHPLFLAAGCGNLEHIKCLIEQGCDINFASPMVL